MKKIKIKVATPKLKKPEVAKYPQPERPSISFNQDQIKGLENLNLDQECEIELKAKVTGINRDRWNEGKIGATFEILSGTLESSEEKDDDESPKNTTEAKNQISKEYARKS